MRQIKPILATFKRHKAGITLIGLQIALTLAIVSNALFIIEQRMTLMSRPTGMIESNLLTIQNHWVGANANAIPSLIKADLLTLRQLPGVADVTQTNTFPLRGGGWTEGVRLDPNMKSRIALAALYFVDDHGLNSMGVKLISGRNFRADEVVELDPTATPSLPQVIITKALADKVYPDGSALGKTIYISNHNPSPSTVVGIIARLQAPRHTASFVDYAVLLPARLTSDNGTYLIRSKQGELDTVTQAASSALVKLNRMRVFSPEPAIRTFNVVRAQAYKNDRGLAIMMGVICIVLLVITAAGIVGLTSFWVGQRRKQIGVRRALGATQRDILSYFLAENLLISAGGVLLGAALAIGLNFWMVSQFEMDRLSSIYVLIGAVVLLLLGQGAVLAPALRASRVLPVEAIRM